MTGSEPKPKRQWSRPKLEVHGTLGELTGQRVKTYGSGDGIVLQIPGGPQIQLSNYS